MEAVFFDLDGTLLDTAEDIRAHVNEMLRTFSYPEITREEVHGYIGDGAKKLIERCVPANATNLEECFAYFSEHFSSSDNEHTVPYDGVYELISALKARGVKIAVITNKPQRAAVRILEKFFPEGTFDFIGGDSGMFDIKPDPSLTRYAALTMHVALKNCVFVGDGEADVLTAKNVGMRSISALWGYRTRQQLTSAGAKEFASSFGELAKFLENF